TSSRFDHISPAAVGLAALLHGAVVVALLTAPPRHSDPMLDVVEVSLEQELTPPPTPKPPDPPPVEAAAPPPPPPPPTPTVQQPRRGRGARAVGGGGPGRPADRHDDGSQRASRRTAGRRRRA